MEAATTGVTRTIADSHEFHHSSPAGRPAVHGGGDHGRLLRDGGGGYGFRFLMSPESPQTSASLFLSWIDGVDKKASEISLQCN